MEQARVTIIGAGPAGLVAALSLTRLNVKSIILERELDITDDPRGVYLAADAIRIMYDLGLGMQIPLIGHQVSEVQFHRSSFANAPVLTQDLNHDTLQQGVESGILQMQPVLERSLCDAVTASELCELRRGCEVQKLIENDAGVEVHYKASDGSMKEIQTTWLIGGDGKRGVVRKTFLEPVADIRQVDSDYRYTGTWVAANIRIHLPTPETHPDFPPFASGLSPQEAYDLFWPEGWHFCSPPGKPTACGRFGPYEERLWRHEFAEEHINEKSLDVERLFWEHITPMVTRTIDAKGNRFHKEAVWPKGTIEILRCRPFTFTHKVVNRWFHKKSVLIGDAAHVFPPFGGQGIASGIRDAHQLAWRIALLESQPQSSHDQVVRILDAWAAERTQSIKDAAHFTSINARMCNEGLPETFNLPAEVPAEMDPQTLIEQRGFTTVPGGFYLPQHKGGLRLPQVYLDSQNQSKLLSDSIFNNEDSLLRLLVLGDAHARTSAQKAEYEALLKDLAIPETVIAPTSTAFLSSMLPAPSRTGPDLRKFTREFAPTAVENMCKTEARRGYNPSAFEIRFGRDVQYILVRPDFFAFAAARDFWELKECLVRLKSWLE